MVEYFFYKSERFRPEGGNHINNQVKYWCEPIDSKATKPKIGCTEIKGNPVHPYTDDNPYRLFGKIASLFKLGDTITTLDKSKVSARKLGSLEVELEEPLSHDELRILSIQVLEALYKQK